MTINSYNEYKTKLNSPYQTVPVQKNAVSAAAGSRYFSQWLSIPFAGVAPTTAAICDNTTAGAMGQLNSSSNQRIIGISTGCNLGCSYILCDRLSHQGGLDGTVTTAQTTNLPTAALTRYTNGVGVMAAVEVYTAAGASAVTMTASYTNQAGTSGQTTIATDFGTSAYSSLSRFNILPYQEGDSGVKSVESLTLSATTGTAGNFGITLFKPLLILGNYSQGTYSYHQDALLNFSGYMPIIQNGACLFWLVLMPSTPSGFFAQVRFSED